MRVKYHSFLLSFLILFSCGKKEQQFDSSGSFETDETIISAEATGPIRVLDLTEGQSLKAGQVIGYIDTIQLYYKKRQLERQIGANLSQLPDVSAQLASLRQQLKTAEHELNRTRNVVATGAAVGKELDDRQAQVDLLKKQIAAQESSLNVSTKAITQSASPIMEQIAQLNDQLQKSYIINPINGTVLTKYAQANEMATTGKALYKIADLSYLNLRAYITGNQFAQAKIGQQVKVFTDDGNGKYKNYDGTIIWIADKAEFTPKTIQTKEERANLVYAIKVRVKNDGFLKIGMYADLNLTGHEK